MKKFVWIVVAIVLAIWSGLAWLIHSVVGFGGNLAAGNADVIAPMPPEAVEWLSWLALFGTGFAEWLVFAVWAVGAIILLAIGFLGNSVVPRILGAVRGH